jgi:glycogen operon protein
LDCPGDRKHFRPINTWLTQDNETLIGGAGATYSQCGESLLLLISK